jgi:hypothetical protein
MQPNLYTVTDPNHRKIILFRLFFYGCFFKFKTFELYGIILFLLYNRKDMDNAKVVVIEHHQRNRVIISLFSLATF